MVRVEVAEVMKRRRGLVDCRRRGMRAVVRRCVDVVFRFQDLFHISRGVRLDLATSWSNCAPETC